MSLVHQVPREAGASISGGASEDQIHTLTEQLGFEVPEELRMWLRMCNAPPIGPGGLFGISPDNPSLDIAAHLALCPGWRDNQWIPIAGDGNGNYYVLAGHTDFGRPIFFVDHEIDLARPAYVVASDLWHFLRFLLREEQGIRYWPFDKQQVLADDPLLQSYSNAPWPWEAT